MPVTARSGARHPCRNSIPTSARKRSSPSCCASPTASSDSRLRTKSIWRLCKRKHAALDGEGARLAGGRWNSRGTAVVYASDSLSLAALELLVHCDPALLPDDLVAIAIEIPDGLALLRIEIAELPRSWRRHPAPASLARIGDLWAKDLASAVLSVPSAVVPGERNVLVNPRHPDFRRIRVGRPEKFALDARLAGRL